MAIIVKKFGGTSVGSIDKIKRIADHILNDIKEGDNIVVVVSAMGKTTDHLFKLAYEITEYPNQREMDMLVTAGERITMALLSLSLQKLGIQSISFTGSQSGIITDNSHGNAKILTVNAYRIPQEFKKNKVVIVAGFQGVSLEKEITTLGRGGSDTTAVSLACFLDAKICEIFTDVSGVFTADPRIVNNARKLEKISYEEMLYLTFSGSKVLHSRAAEFAYKYKIPVEVKSSFENIEGTMIEHKMESSTVNAISNKDEIVIFNVDFKNSDIPAFTTEIFDIEVKVSSSNNMKTGVFYIEKKYLKKFISEIKEHNLSYKQDSITFCVINMLGYRICKDIMFFANLNKDLTEIYKKTYLIKNQGIGVQILVEQTDATEIIQFLHKKYILSESI